MEGKKYVHLPSTVYRSIEYKSIVRRYIQHTAADKQKMS
jgi:hypothetical protein